MSSTNQTRDGESSPIPRLANFVLFQAVWLITILGVAQDRVTDGWFALAVFLLIHYFLSRTAIADYALCAIVVLIGGVVDNIYLGSGLLNFHAALPGLAIAPPWTSVLWCALALTLNNCLAWLHGRPFLTTLLGAVGGSLSYLAGINLGAASLGVNTLPAMLWLAGTWAIITPALFYVAGRVRQRIPQRAIK